MSERVECSTNDTALAFPDIKDIYDQNRTAEDQFLPTPLMMTNKMADNQSGPDIFFSFSFGLHGLPLGRNRGERVAAPAPSRVS